jgi:hypothetical protein
MEMAKEMAIAKIIDIETFLYVIKNGRFPPWDELIMKEQQKQQMLQQPQNQEPTQQEQPQLNIAELLAGGGGSVAPA